MSLLGSWETLRLHQEEDERLILSQANDGNLELVRHIFEKTKVTKEDLRRKYTPEEVRQLCQRTKVRVNMTHVNCVYDAKKRLDAMGSLTNKSYRFVNAMLIKAINRGMAVPYPDEVVARQQYINLCELKRENNLRLDRWKKELELELDGIGDDDDDEIMQEAGDQADCNYIGDKAAAPPSPQKNQQPDWLRDIDEINSESMTLYSDDLLQSQILSQSEGMTADCTTFNTQVQASSTQDSDADKLL